MLVGLLFSAPLVFLLVAIALVVSITIHEFAHAWMADRLGDPTPRHQGRVTLDPRAHLDPIGTAAIFFFGFGWGRPVMFDPYNLKDPVKETALIALAGPASNLILATGLAILSALIPEGPALFLVLQGAMETILFVNVMLAIFNLVPIHPLDGGKIVLALLPRDLARDYDMFMRQYGTWVLIALILPWGGRSPVSFLVRPIIDVVVGLLLSLGAII